MSLPYDKMTNIGMLFHFYMKRAEMVKKGNLPEEIVEEFFKKHTELETEDQN